MYRDFADITSTDYLLSDAERYIDDMLFDKAIRNLDEVLKREPSNSQAKYLYSIAHSGRGGLRVIKMFETLTNSGSASLFTNLAESFESVDQGRLRDFSIAVQHLESIGPTADDRDANQNFYALFLYLGRVGALLNHYAYDDDNNQLSATFSACHTIEDKSGPKTGMPDDDIDIVMTTIPRIIETVVRLSEQGSTGNIIDTSGLEAIGTFSRDPLPCSDDSMRVECLAVRSIINNPNTGIGLGTGSGFPIGMITEADGCPLLTP